MSALETAKKLAAAGVATFPCGPDKRPLVRWREASTIDAASLPGMWRANALPAIDLAKAGLVAIDCDRHGGPDGVAAFLGLADRYGLPEGVPIVETPSGGRHYIFRQPVGAPFGNATGALPKGIDVRGAGGYIIAPGAALPDGRAWRQIGGPDLAAAFFCGTIPTLPQWLGKLIRPPKAARELPSAGPRAIGTRDEEYARAALEAECAKLAETAEGGRNQALNVAAFSAGTLIGAGWIDRGECETALYDAALASGLDDDETAATIASGLTAGIAKPRGPLGERPASSLVWPPLDGRAIEVRAPARDGEPFAGVVFDGDAATEAPRMLVKGLLPYDGICFIGGQSGAGKTFVAVDLALSLASGEPFFGRKVSERVGVMILAAEGGGTIANRVAVARNEKAQGEILPIAWTSAVPELSKPREVAALVEKLKAVRERFKETHGVRLGVIIIDTLAAAFGLEDENNNSEAARAIRQMNTIAQALGVLIIPVHHYGKGEETGLRGASAWRAGADVVLSVLADRNQSTGKVSNRRLALAKARNGEEGELSAFDLRFVELGKDEDFEPFGACVVEPTAGAERGSVPKASRAARVYLAALETVLRTKGAPARPFGDEGPEVRAVDREDVRAEFYRSWPADGDSAKRAAATRRQRFNRGEAELSDAGAICARQVGPSTVVWAVSDDSPF